MFIVDKKTSFFRVGSPVFETKALILEFVKFLTEANFNRDKSALGLRKRFYECLGNN